MQDKLRWLFYIEGGITILVTVCAILPDFPHNTRWFAPEESAILISRLVEDGYGKADKLRKQTTMKGLRDTVSVWEMRWLSVAAMFQAVGQSFFTYFPTLCVTLGYDTTVTLFLRALPWPTLMMQMVTAIDRELSCELRMQRMRSN